MYKVVIVDDEPMVCRWLKEKIDWQNWQCEVVGVGHNGIEGKVLVEQHRPDILLSDVKMPGMDGLVLSSHVLEHYPKTLVLMLSGYNEFNYVRSALRNNVFDYLLKPIDTDEFKLTMDKVSVQLEERQAREQKDAISERRLEDSSELTESGILMKLIINGNKELPSLKSKMARLGLELGKGRPIIYQLHRNPDSEHDKWTPVYQYAVHNILLETFERYQCTPVVFHIGDRCVVVIKFPAGIPVSTSERRVLEAAREGLENVKMYLKSSQSLGIGPVFQSAGELHDAYRAAELSLIQQYFWLDESIPSMYRADILLEEMPFTIDPSFYDSIEKGDKEAAAAVLSSVSAQLRRIGKRDLVYSVCTEILIRLSKTAEKWNKELDFLPLMSGMKQYRTFALLMQELGEVVTSLCSWIAEQKTYAVASLPEKIVMYVQKHYSSPGIHLGALSDHFHISLSHISRLFTKATGTNFNEYISQLRVDLARQLMEREHWLSNQEIAERVGYNDGRYFSQVFKKHCGKTPNEYRGRRESKV